MDTINLCNVYDKNEFLDLIIDKDTNINLFNEQIKKINIKVLNNVFVNLNEFTNLALDKKEITITINNNSTLNYNLSSIIDRNHTLDIKINYEGNESNVNANIHSIVKGTETINITGTIKNESKNNTLLERVKVMLLEDGKCEVNPDIEIKTNAVNANHLVAISNIRDNELFYLMSKGISISLANDLIKRSFLIGNIQNEELKMKINEYL